MRHLGNVGWQKELLEEGASVFDRSAKKSSRQKTAEAARIAKFEAKVQDKNEEVLAELMGEHVVLWSFLGLLECGFYRNWRSIS